MVEINFINIDKIMVPKSRPINNNNMFISLTITLCHYTITHKQNHRFFKVIMILHSPEKDYQKVYNKIIVLDVR